MGYETREVAQYRFFEITKNLESDQLLEIQKKIEECVQQKQSDFVLHFIGINFLSSKTISSIIRIWKDVTELKGSLFLISSQPIVAELFRFCVGGKSIAIFESVEEFEKKMAVRKSGNVHLGIREKGEHRIIDVLSPVTVTQGLGELSKKLSDLQANGQKHVALNLTDSDTIYSEFAGLIKKWNWIFTNNSGTFGLINPNQTVKLRLSLMGLDKFVKVYESEEQIEITPVKES